MATMKVGSFLLMTITTLIILSSSITSAREFQSAPLDPQVEQGKFLEKLLNCGSGLFFKGWACWHDFVAKITTPECCQALLDNMDCPFDIIPEADKEHVKNFCNGVDASSNNVAVFGPVSSPVRLPDLVKNMTVQAHDNGEN